MCGIVGHLSHSEPIDRSEFMRMRETLLHRGPDDAGVYFNATNTVALGHRRLSFLDLSPAGRQPMPSADGRCWLTFNGEIYNYLELRDQLEQRGHCFRTQSDSEVILAGYRQWGSGVIEQLKGMFAFAVYDAATDDLLLARDRFGIKPLYYHEGPDQFLFASELKALLACSRVPRRLAAASIWDYFAYRYVPSPKTIWRDISKLPPAHFLLRRADGSTTLHEYWKLPLERNDRPPLDEAVDHVDQLLLDSVREHVRSDVPVGSFLSGGYDSSALVYYLSRVNYPRRTFAIGFEGWDESEHQYANLVARRFDSRHTDLILDDASLGLVEPLMYFYDEPIADISIVPTYLVSQEASRHVKTVLSGEGADELFGGYTWQLDYQQHLRRRAWWQRLPDGLPGIEPLAVRRYGEYMAMGRFQTAELRRLLHPDLAPSERHDADWWYRSLYRPTLTPLKSIQYLDMKAFMGELVLTKIDRASMAHSLEVRVPFLDHELYEYVCRLHERSYFCAKQTKRLLYELVKRHLPREILERKKQGFVGPDRYYSAIDFYARAIYDGALLSEGVIRRDYVDQLVAQRDQWRLWKIMVFEYWYRRWVSDSPVPTVRRADAATGQCWQSHDDGATVAYGAECASGADRMLPLVAHDMQAPSAPLAK